MVCFGVSPCRDKEKARGTYPGLPGRYTLRLPFSLRLRIRLTQLMSASYELVKDLNT